MTTDQEESSMAGSAGEEGDVGRKAVRVATDDDLSEVLLQKEKLEARVAAMEIELAQERSAPVRGLLHWLSYHVLTASTRLEGVLPGRTVKRFANSALKRHPHRSITQTAAQTLAAPPGRQAVASVRIAGKRPVREDCRTVIIVSHEASRTGAPILALNLAQHLCERWNVVVVLLNGGVLVEEFAGVSAEVWQLPVRGSRASNLRALVGSIASRSDIAFAIVNSVESRAILPGLAEQGIRSITLIHEFASITNPRTAVDEVLRHTDVAVFSSRLTADNAARESSLSVFPECRVIRQGRCLVPATRISAQRRMAEEAWLDSEMHPADLPAQPFLFLGAGSVGYRKGVDLFLDVAGRIHRARPDLPASFVWIGHGYDPDRDLGYSAYLRDQIERAGLEGKAKFLRETFAIDLAYARADALLLTSRLDPLPNVAIDAICAGIPVFCFEAATGIAEVNEDAGLAPECNSPYLDTADMATKLLNMVGRATPGVRLHPGLAKIGAELFDFGQYARTIEELVLSAPSRDIRSRARARSEHQGANVD